MMDQRIERWIKRARETEGAIRGDTSHPASIDIDDLLELMLDIEGEAQATASAIEREACATICEDVAWELNIANEEEGSAGARSCFNAIRARNIDPSSLLNEGRKI